MFRRLMIAGVVGVLVSALAVNPAEAAVPDAPDAPGVLGGDEQVEVSWVDPPDGGSPIIDYRVDTDRTPSRTVAGSPYTWTGLINGQAYLFRVRACNVIGCGPWSPWSESVTPAATGATEPAAPAAPGVVGGDEQVTVSWVDPLDDGGSPITHHTVDTDQTPARRVDTGTPYTWTGLINGQAYLFRVRACNVIGCGPWSPWSESVTPAAVALFAVI